MDIESVIKDFRERGSSYRAHPDEQEVYHAAARMLETVAQDIVVEYGDADGYKLRAWETIIHRLGIRL